MEHFSIVLYIPKRLQQLLFVIMTSWQLRGARPSCIPIGLSNHVADDVDFSLLEVLFSLADRVTNKEWVGNVMGPVPDKFLTMLLEKLTRVGGDEGGTDVRDYAV